METVSTLKRTGGLSRYYKEKSKSWFNLSDVLKTQFGESAVALGKKRPYPHASLAIKDELECTNELNMLSLKFSWPKVQLKNSKENWLEPVRRVRRRYEFQTDIPSEN